MVARHKREIVAAAGAFTVGALAFALGGTRARPAATAPPRRVISLAPSITETVFALSAGERVVGVSAGVKWPPKAMEVVHVGGYVDVNLERLVGLRPDLVLIQGVHADVHDQATELGIRVQRVRMDTLDGIRAATIEIGEALEVPSAARGLVERIDRELDAVRTRTRGRRRLRTFLHVAYGSAAPRPPFLTAGGGTFLSEILEIAGGENIFSDSSRPYLDVSSESLIERAPEVVMVSVPGAHLTPDEAGAIGDAWRDILPARPGRPKVTVVFLTAECAQVPGPRVGELAREMEKLLRGAQSAVSTGSKGARP